MMMMMTIMMIDNDNNDDGDDDDDDDDDNDDNLPISLFVPFFFLMYTNKISFQCLYISQYYNITIKVQDRVDRA